METSKVINILDSVIARLYDSRHLSQSYFNVCNSGSLSDVQHCELEDIVCLLFDEHTSVTGLINDLTDLRNTLNTFEFIIK